MRPDLISCGASSTMDLNNLWERGAQASNNVWNNVWDRDDPENDLYESLCYVTIKPQREVVLLPK